MHRILPSTSAGRHHLRPNKISTIVCFAWFGCWLPLGCSLGLAGLVPYFVLELSLVTQSETEHEFYDQFIIMHTYVDQDPSAQFQRVRVFVVGQDSWYATVGTQSRDRSSLVW
jgi:hypothetical protein